MDELATVFGVAVLLGLIGLAANFVFGGAWRRYERGRVTVYENEAGLKYVKGVLSEILPAGRYSTWPAPVEITKLDKREQSTAVAGQEILTADMMPVRVSVILVHRIVDPRAFILASSATVARLYQLVQSAMRERVAARDLDALLKDRNSIVAGMAEELAPEAKTLGVEIKAITLLDLTLAGAAKQAYADLWKAQKDGIAALERARGEQASLRALANAARMLKGNPELMNLRLLQALVGQPGKTPPTMVLGAASGIVPVSPNPEDGESPS